MSLVFRSYQGLYLSYSLGESWIKHELEAEQGFFVDSDALTCPEQESG